MSMPVWDNTKTEEQCIEVAEQLQKWLCEVVFANKKDLATKKYIQQRVLNFYDAMDMREGLKKFVQPAHIWLPSFIMTQSTTMDLCSNSYKIDEDSEEHHCKLMAMYDMLHSDVNYHHTFMFLLSAMEGELYENLMCSYEKKCSIMDMYFSHSIHATLRIRDGDVCYSCHNWTSRGNESVYALLSVRNHQECLHQVVQRVPKDIWKLIAKYMRCKKCKTRLSTVTMRVGSEW